MDDTRPRFLAAIACRLGADRIVELHLFSPIRQGVLETGVAVVAVTRGGEEARCGEEAQAQCGEGAQAQCGTGEEDGDLSAKGESLAPEYAFPADAEPSSFPSHAVPGPLPVPAVQDHRLVVFTARYRLTRKGPDRGTWLFECDATADAPLATVDAVARGVTQRSKDLTETERLSGDQLRTLLQDPTWRLQT